MIELKNRVGCAVVGAPGTGDITLGAAITTPSSHQDFATAYGANATVDLLIEDGTAWEIARDCAYDNTAGTVTRGTLEDSSTGAVLDLTSAAKVYVTHTAARMEAAQTHAASTSNPHGVTAAQVGATTTAVVDAKISLHNTPMCHSGLVGHQCYEAGDDSVGDTDRLLISGPDTFPAWILRRITWANVKSTLLAAFKLDDLAAPDDNTDLNASTSAHGLMPKLGNVAKAYFNGQGSQTQVGSTQLSMSATDKLVGRATAGAGDSEEITCTAAGRAILDDADAAAQRATLNAGYALPVVSGALTPSASTTYYIATLAPVSPQTNYNTVSGFVPRAGKIKTAQIRNWCGTAPSSEDWSLYIRINDTTDYLIQTVASTATTNRSWVNTSLDISVSQEDTWAIKIECPAWVTAPTSVRFGGHIYIE